MPKVPFIRSVVSPKHSGVILAVLICASLVVTAAVLVADRIRGLRDSATQMQRQIVSIEQRVGRLELQVETLLAKRLLEASAAPNRADRETPTKDTPGKSMAALAQADIDTVRDYIKIPPPPVGATPTIGLGMSVGNHVLVPLPSQVIDKVPRLAGARFTTDRNGSIVIVTGNGGRADFIIPPK